LRKNKVSMLCPTCLQVRAVKEALYGTIHLACGHERTTALLPARGVSLEHRTTEQGYKWFPAVSMGFEFRERIRWF
jgi:hypothetical protein